jgi:hypothetical protein
VDVDWGDGTAHTSFSVTSQGSLGSRSHTYGEEGLNTVTVVVTSNTGAGGSVTFRVAVSDPAVVATAVNFSAVPGVAFTGQAVATFTDAGGPEPNAADPNGNISNHYTATITWGDGSAATAGTITISGGVFTVSGGHTYAAVGTYAVAVTITHEASAQAVANGTATVSTTTSGQVNFVDFETGDFSQTASHVNGAVESTVVLDGHFSLQFLRSNSVANAEIRASGTTYYNLPTAYYSFLFQFASQTGEGGVVNFQDTASGYKAAIHLSAAGKLLFYDINGNLAAMGTTTLNPNQTYTISAKIGTGMSGAFEVRINGTAEMSGTANLGPNNNGSIKLGGGTNYTTNYYYDDVAINSQNYPSSPAPPGGSSAPMLLSQNQASAPVGTVQVSATGSTPPGDQLMPLSGQPLPLRLAGQDTPTWPVVTHGQTAATAVVDSFFADWGNSPLKYSLIS